MKTLKLMIVSQLLFFVYSCNETVSKVYQLTKSVYATSAGWTCQTSWRGLLRKTPVQNFWIPASGRKQIVLMYLSHVMTFSEGNRMSCDIYQQESWLNKEREGLASVRTEQSISNSTVMPKLCDDVYAIVYLDGPRGRLIGVGGMGDGFIHCFCYKSNTS